MPVSGLVLTLDPREPALTETLAALAADPRITLGPQQDHRLAIALDTPSQSADRDAWAALMALPSVTWIDLAYITIDPAEADLPKGARHERS